MLENPSLSRAETRLENFLLQWRRRWRLQAGLEALVSALLISAALLAGGAGLTWIGWLDWKVLSPGTMLLLLAAGVFFWVGRAVQSKKFSRESTACRIDRFLPDSADRWRVWIELQANGAPSDPFARLRDRDLLDFLERSAGAGAVLPAIRCPVAWFPSLLALMAAVVLWQVAIEYSTSREVARTEALALLQERQELLNRQEQTLLKGADAEGQVGLFADIERARARLTETMDQLENQSSGSIGPAEQARIALATAAAEIRNTPPEPWTLENPPDSPSLSGPASPAGLTDFTAASAAARPLTRSSEFSSSATEWNEPPTAAGGPEELRQQLLAGLRPESSVIPPPSAPLSGATSGRLAELGEGTLRSAQAGAGEAAVRVPWSGEFQPGARGESLPGGGGGSPDEIREGGGQFRLPELREAVAGEIRRVLVAAEKFPPEALVQTELHPGVFLAEALPTEALPPGIPPRARATVQRYFQRLRQATAGESAPALP